MEDTTLEPVYCPVCGEIAYFKDNLPCTAIENIRIKTPNGTFDIKEIPMIDSLLCISCGHKIPLRDRR